MKNKINSMRTFYQIIAMATMAVVTFSCVGDDDFTVPTFNDTALIEIDGEVVEMNTIASQIAQSNDGTVTFEQINGKDIYVIGYVISDDQGGNWFKELIIQDAPENPTSGISISIDVNPLFTRYEFGRRVYIKLTGLTASESNGVTTIGIAGTGNNIERIASSQEQDFIKRDNLVETIVPLELSFNEFTEQTELIWIRVNDVQFILEDIDRCFACEPGDNFDGERTIKNCADDTIAALLTSTFSDYKSLNIPDGSGFIDALLTRDFTGDDFVLYVNTPENFNLTSTDRCDPIPFIPGAPISCGNAGGSGSNTLLNETFETQSTGAIAMPAGWRNIQSRGSETWEVYTSGGNNPSIGKSVRVGSFNSGDASTVAWLVTPIINFDAQTGEVFSFETSNSFADGSRLEVFYSSNWDGIDANINLATWQELDNAIIVSNGEPFANWVSSGNVSLDCITGSGRLAFRYAGSGNSDLDGTYELDNISLTSN